MTTILVMLAILNGEPKVVADIVPTAKCEEIAKQVGAVLGLNPDVSEVHWSCIHAEVGDPT